MEIERDGRVAVAFIDGAQFDELVRSLDLDERESGWRDGWLSRRFTPFLSRDGDADSLFARFGVVDEAGLALVDEAYEADFRTWARRAIEEFN